MSFAVLTLTKLQAYLVKCSTKLQAYLVTKLQACFLKCSLLILKRRGKICVIGNIIEKFPSV